MQVRSITAAAGVALVLALGACSGEKKETTLTETTETTQSSVETGTATATASTGGTVGEMTAEDKEFVSKAGMGGLAEVQMATLALQKAQSADVKAFAQRMFDDHSKANDQLTQLATAKGLALPTELEGTHKAALDHLSSLSGAEFDSAYMQHMVSDHQTDVAEFEKASTGATDADVKGWAATTLPTLQEHLKLAQEVAGKVK